VRSGIEVKGKSEWVWRGECEQEARKRAKKKLRLPLHLGHSPQNKRGKKEEV